ncbi:MAG TPA: Calx-beta domain-containing protein [Xanthomonadales bacterium]|nr:Calx-beta domain-containing protein [Xanthomonadales bacterium]
MRRGLLGLVLAVAAQGAAAQDLVVFDDAARNGFDPGFSYNGGTDLGHTTTVHTGTTSIAFTGNDTFNAVAFARTGVADLTTAQYPTLRFFVHGGTTGGQQLRLFIQRDSETASTVVAQGELDAYIAGGSVAANAWREVTVPLAAFGVSGGFDRIDIQSDTGVQPVLYLDDIVLVAPVAQADPIFLDGFEGSDPGPAGTLQFTPASPDQNVGENTATATFTVSRTGGTAGAVSVDVQLGGTAAVQADYTVAPAALQLAWAAGDGANKTVTLTLVDDAADEPNETVTLQLASPTGGAALGTPAAATLTIVDNDPSPSAGTLQFTPASPNQSVAETNGAVTFTVSRTGGTAGAVGTTVALGGTAANPADYTNGALALSWPDGDATSRTVTITPVADLVEEPAETVTLQLGAPTGGATLGTPSSATLTISDAELLFVPQYAGDSIKVYRRGPAGFALVNTASLGAGVRPNAIAFAPDGKLWVVGEGAANPASLRRYDRNAVVTGVAVAAERTILAQGGCCLFDLAFFGDFAYVSQSDFGATDRILKYPLASLEVNGTPVPTVLANASLDVPSGLEFDPQGRLWVSNTAFNMAENTSVVRMDTTSGAVDRIFTSTIVAGRNALIRPEGLAFDAFGSLWVGNNGEQTIAAYSAAQLAGAGGAVVPAHLIDASPGEPLLDGTFGGVAFDSIARLWANYQKSPFEVREYVVTSANGGASYTSALGQVLTNATTFPGFGGLAFWPVPATVHRSGSGVVVAAIQHEQDVVVRSMESDRFTWQDAAGRPRVAVLAHNDGQVGPFGGVYPNRGGAMREYRYRLPNGTERVVGPNTSGNTGQGGFGYVVSHPKEECGGDGSPLGYGTPGTFQRLAIGRHHAIFRFTQDYPRRCNAAGVEAPVAIPVTIDWFFATGRDHPLWAVTYDLAAAPAGIDANELNDDSRAPYGELMFEGVATEGERSLVSGVGWGDRFRFATTPDAGPVSYNSAWTWSAPNTVPYVKLWTTGTDATMGTVQTQTIVQHDAGGYFGTSEWGDTSATVPLACTIVRGGIDTVMPCDYNWPYQSINYEMNHFDSPNNTTRSNKLAWGTNFGFVGRTAYPIHGSSAGEIGGPVPGAPTASGWPRQSYATYVVLGRHSDDPVGAQVAEIEAVQATAFSALVGTVATQGIAGPARVDNAAYEPAGWDHVYGVWTVEVATNAADVNFSVGGGRTLKNPIVNIRNWQGTTLPASVSFNGVPLVQDVDYFPSIVDDANELLITLARTVSGANNRLQVSQ